LNGVQSPQAGSSQTTLQAAMSAAGTTGAMEIPPSYAGKDGFTNPNGVHVTDLRPTSSQQFERSVKEFGAVCDGTTDDTNALQAALNYAETHGVALTIPQGTCKTRTLIWHGESIGGLGKQVSALMGFPGQDVLISVTDSSNLLSYTRIHDLTIYVDQSQDASCSAAEGRAPAGNCTMSRLLENNSIFSHGGSGLTGTTGSGTAWAVGNCAIAMPAATGAGGNGLRVAEIENLEIVATGTDPMAAQYPGAHSTHTCGMYLAQWPQWSEFRNIDIRGVNTGIAIPALPGTAPAGLNADSNRWQNITIQAAHGFTAAAGSNNVLDNVVVMTGNSAATAEPPTGMVLDIAGSQQGWTVRNAVVLPTWNAVQPQLTVTASGGAVTGVIAGPEHGLGFDPYGAQVPLQFSGSCTAQASASVNSDGSIGTISVTQGGVGCSGTTTASVNVAGSWDTAAPVNLVSGQNMTFFGGNLLKGNGGYTVWNASVSQSYGTQLGGAGGTLPGGGSYPGLVANSGLGTTLAVDQFTGVDFGAKLQACLRTVSASYGGTCDARNFTGNLSMSSNLSISTANTNVLLPCATISTANQVIVTAGTRNVALRGCALRGASAASGSQGGTVFLYSGQAAMVQVGDPTYSADTMGFHMDDVVINTTASSNATTAGLVAYRTQEMDLESLYFLGNSNQTGMTLDGTGNYTGGTFFDNAFNGFQTAVNAIGHQASNPATTDWMNASSFVRLHIDCPMSGGSPISGTYGINLAAGDGNTFTGGDVEGCSTALHLGPNAQNNTIVGLRNENSSNQVVADAGSSYNNWMTGGTMFTGQLTDNGTRNSFMDTFHRSFNGMNGDWYGSQKDATVTNHYRLGIGSGNERGLLDRYQTDSGYRWTMGLSDATAGEQYYQVLDELNNVNRISVGQYNNGQASTNNQTVINAAGTGAVVLNGSTNSGTGGVVIGSGGANESTVATIGNSGNAQFNGTLQVGSTSTLAGTPTVKNQADTEIDSTLWAGLTASQKESFIYKDWNGASQWYMVKDASNNWALNSAIGGLDSFKAYQSTNSGDTYINASNPSGIVRVNYENGSGAGFNIYGGNSGTLYAGFTGASSIKFPGLAASSGHYCLQIDNSGYLSNTGSACGTGTGGTSGTVSTGTAGQIAYYTSSGSVIGGTNSVAVTSGGTGATTSSGALANLGAMPIAGGTFSGIYGQTVINPPLWNRSGYMFPAHWSAPLWNGQHTQVSCCDTLALDVATSSFTVPGINYGNATIGPQGWTSHVLRDWHFINNGEGGLQDVVNIVQAGVGDSNDFYHYALTYGGTVGASDEGFHTDAINGGEASSTYQGTVTAGGAGTTSLMTICTADCGNQGDGRYIIDVTSPITTGYVSAYTQPSGETPGTFTISSTVTPSTAWGTLAADCSPATIPNPAGTGTEPVTCIVNVTSGTFTAGSLVTFAGQFHEQTLITSATTLSGGQQTLGFNLRAGHENTSWIMQGGAIGFINFTANNGTGGLKYPIDILGATDSRTLIYRYFDAGYTPGTVGFSPGSVHIGQYSAVNISNSGGTVTFTPQNVGSFVGIAFFQGQPITISGASNSAFNGTCSGATINAVTSTVSCTQSSSTGDTATALTFALGDTAYGNGDFTLYAGAEVLDVQDPAANYAVDGAFTIEPNNALWNTGDAVEVSHHYAASINGSTRRLAVFNQNPISWNGQEVDLSGSGIVGGNGNNGTSAANGSHAAAFYRNQNPFSMYSYGGGLQTPPAGITLSGPFQSGLGMLQAPSFQGTLLSAGCPGNTLGCNDPSYSYNIFSVLGNGYGDYLQFTPYTNSFLLQGMMGFAGSSSGFFGISPTHHLGLTKDTSNYTADGILDLGALNTANLSVSALTGYVYANAGAMATASTTIPAASIATGALANGMTATTQTPGDNSTRVATDAFVLANAGSGVNAETPAWLQYLGTGADGANISASGSMHGDYYYTNFTVPYGNTVTNSNVAVTLVIHATGACTIAGTINARGADEPAGYGPGIGGGSGGGSGGGASAGTSGTISNPTISTPLISVATGGGASGAASGGTGGSGTTPYINWQQRMVLSSSAGSDGIGLSGGAGKQGGNTGGAAGTAGGGVVLICGSIVGTDGTHTGIIDVSGGYGGPAAANSTGAGSGGGGGVPILSSQAAVSTWPTVYMAGGPGGLVTVPEAVATGGSCTSQPKLTLGVTAGALSGTATVVQAGAGCGTGAGITWNILGGGGTQGTATINPTWSGGALVSGTVTPGTSSGYTAAAYTNAGNGGDGGAGWSAEFQGW
jgi:hypothetical protein